MLYWLSAALSMSACGQGSEANHVPVKLASAAVNRSAQAVKPADVVGTPKPIATRGSQLELQGVFFDEAKQRRVAIMGVDGFTIGARTVGDDVQGKRLRAITDDDVMLELDGRIERIRLRAGSGEHGNPYGPAPDHRTPPGYPGRIVSGVPGSE